MSVSARIIRARIKSVGNTKKITKAMELVSAAKMRRAVSLATSARRYEELGNALLGHLSHLGAASGHPLCVPRPKARKRSALSSLRTAGSAARTMFRSCARCLAEMPKDRETDFVVCGRFVELALRRAGKNIVASFSGLTASPNIRSIRPIMSMAESEFQSGVYGSVYLATTDFISALRQTPRVDKLLPVAPPDREEKTIEERFSNPTLPPCSPFFFPGFLKRVCIRRCSKPRLPNTARA